MSSQPVSVSAPSPSAYAAAAAPALSDSVVTLSGQVMHVQHVAAGKDAWYARLQTLVHHGAARALVKLYTPRQPKLVLGNQATESSNVSHGTMRSVPGMGAKCSST